MSRIFCISGLGADGRVFEQLQLPGVEFVYLPWPVLNKEDTMQSYAAKIARLITDKEPIVLGLSFGGMLAVELSKIISTKKVFLISSARTRKEVGYNFPLWEFLVNKELVPFRLFRLFAPLSQYRLGIETKEEQLLVTDMIQHIQADFLKNATRVIVNWDNEIVSPDIIQLHGAKDKIILPHNVHPTHWIKGGGHFMIYNRAETICKLLQQYL